MSSPKLLLELLAEQDQVGFEFVREEFRRRITHRHQELNLPPAPDVHTDFGKAFKNRSRFKGGDIDTRVEVVQTTDIVVPSGRVVICDPSMSDRGPLERTVTPGKYPVILSLCSGNTVVAAMLRVKRKKAVQWERATWVDEQGRQRRVYGVEGGTGCFVDLEVAGHLDNWDNIPPFGEASPDNPHAFLWGNRVLAPETGANVVTFSTGGDGGVASYWGLDSSGAVVALVSDVTPMVEEQRVVLKISRILSTVRGEIRHQLLDSIGVIMEVIPNAADHTLAVGFFGPKTHTAFVTFENERGRSVTPEEQGGGASGTMENAYANLCFFSSEYTLPQTLAAEATLVAHLAGEDRQL